MPRTKTSREKDNREWPLRCISEQTPPRRFAQLREAPEKLPKVPIEVVQLEPQISGKTLTDGPAAAFQRGSAFDGLF